MANTQPLPLFPLSEVLFPGGEIALRIFEARYIDMVGRCMRTESPFGVILIKHGSEVGAAETFDVGTFARIQDWRTDNDGLLGITALGQERFVLEESYRDASGLYMGLVRSLPSEPPCPVPREYSGLADLLDIAERGDGAAAAADAVWLSYRLAERLPVDRDFKQALLECDNAIERLGRMIKLLESGLIVQSTYD